MFATARARSWPAIGLGTRVFLGGVVLVAVVLTLVFGLLTRWAERSGDAIVRRELEQSADLVAQFLSGRQRSLTGGARVFVQGPYFRTIVAEPRREDILDQTLEAAEQLDADWVFIVNERGTLLAKSDEQSASGGDMSAVPLVAGALQGRITSGFGISRDSLLFQAVAVPIVVPGGAPIGALVATKVVDSPLALDVKAATSADIVFFVRDGSAAPRIAASSFSKSTVAPLAAEMIAQPRARVVIAGARFATQAAAVTTAGGNIIGGYVVMSARDAASAEIAEVRRALLLALLLGILLSALAAVLATRRLARPMRDLTAMATRAAEGDVRVALSPLGAAPGGIESEIGALGGAVQLLVADVRDRQALGSALIATVPMMDRPAAVASAEVAPALAMHRVQGGPSRVSGSIGARPVSPIRSGEGAHGEPAAGDLIAERYRIDAVLGSGQFGVTYRARDRTAGTVVALKRLHSERHEADLGQVVELLRDDVRALRPLMHRNVIAMLDVGESRGAPFVTMDYVEGVSLARVLRASGPLGDTAVLSLARQLCRALIAAEACEVVHGSLSPRQLLIGYDGVLRVGDFALVGFARRRRDRASAPAGSASDAAIPHLAGATVGSPEYMAPEQLLGELPTVRSDLYAAGVVLYECVTGATPFRTDSPLAFLAQKLGGAGLERDPKAVRPDGPSRNAIAPVLSAVIARMIAADADRRPASAGALLELLERAD